MTHQTEIVPASREATREAWLIQASKVMEGWFIREGFPAPARYQVSVGWPLGTRKSVVGQCFPSSTGVNGMRSVFISPTLDFAPSVLKTLLHELIHVVDDCMNGHQGPFITMAKALGLIRPWTASNAGLELLGRLNTLACDIGPYPHARVTPAESAAKKQGTRMKKIECPGCGYVARTTAKWLAVGLPTCPCGAEMQGEDDAGA